MLFVEISLGEEPYSGSVSCTVLKTSSLWRHRGLSLTDALVIQIFWQYQGWPIIDVSDFVLATYNSSVRLDRGEIEVLAIAQHLSDPLLLLDDEMARTEARRLNLPVRGTLGVLVQSYQQGLLSLT